MGATTRRTSARGSRHRRSSPDAAWSDPRSRPCLQSRKKHDKNNNQERMSITQPNRIQDAAAPWQQRARHAGQQPKRSRNIQPEGWRRTVLGAGHQQPPVRRNLALGRPRFRLDPCELLAQLVPAAQQSKVTPGWGSRGTGRGSQAAATLSGRTTQHTTRRSPLQHHITQSSKPERQQDPTTTTRENLPTAAWRTSRASCRGRRPPDARAAGGTPGS